MEYATVLFECNIFASQDFRAPAFFRVSGFEILAAAHGEEKC